MVIDCWKHGKIEVEPNADGDVFCPACREEKQNRDAEKKELKDKLKRIDRMLPGFSMSCRVKTPSCPICSGEIKPHKRFRFKVDGYYDEEEGKLVFTGISMVPNDGKTKST